MNIFVAKLNYATSEDALRQAFEEFGTVDSAKVIMDRDTQRSKGFGFVEMQDREGGTAAVEALDQQPIGGRNVSVNEARPREERSGGGGGGNRNNRW